MAQEFRIQVVVDPSGARRGVSTTERELGKVERAASRMGSALRSAFAFLAAGTLATAGVRSLASYEDGLVGVAKTADLTEERLDLLGERVLNMSSDLPVATAELLEIAQAAGSLGVQGVDDLTAFTDTVAKLGTASDVAGERATNSLARLLTVTDEQFSQVGRLASVVVRLGNEYAATESEILDVATRVAQSSAAFDVTSGQAAALGAAMRSVGIEAELGGTQFGVALRSIAEAVATGGDQLERYGAVAGTSGAEFAAAFNESNYRGFQLFIEGLGRLSAEEQVLTLKALGFEASRSGAVLGTLAAKSDLVADAQATMADELRKGTALEIESARGADTLSSDWTRLVNVSRALAVRVGEGGVGGALRGVVQTTSDVLRVFAGLEDGFQGSRAAAESIATAIRSGGAALVTYGAALGAIKLGGFVADLLESAEAIRVQAGAQIATLEASTASTAAKIREIEATRALTVVTAESTAAGQAQAQAELVATASRVRTTSATLAATQAENARLLASTSITDVLFAANVQEGELVAARAVATAESNALAAAEARLSAAVAAGNTTRAIEQTIDRELVGLKAVLVSETDALAAAKGRLAAAQSAETITTAGVSVAFKGLIGLLTGPVGIVLGVTAAYFAISKLIDGMEDVPDVTRAAALGLEDAGESAKKYADALEASEEKAEGFLRAQAELNAALRRGDASAAADAIEGKVRELDAAVIGLQQRIDTLKGGFTDVEGLRLRIPTLDVAPLRAQLVEDLSGALGEAFASGDLDALLASPLLSQLDDIGASASEFGREVQSVLSAAATEFSDVSGEAERLRLIAEKLVDTLGFQRIPDTQAIEVLEAEMERLRGSIGTVGDALAASGAGVETFSDEVLEARRALAGYLEDLRTEASLLGLSEADRERSLALREAERLAVEAGVLAEEDHSAEILAGIRTREDLARVVARLLTEYERAAAAADESAEAQERARAAADSRAQSLAGLFGQLAAVRAESERVTDELIGLSEIERERAQALRDANQAAAGAGGGAVAIGVLAGLSVALQRLVDLRSELADAEARESAEAYLDRLREETALIGRSADQRTEAEALREAEAAAIGLQGEELEAYLARVREEIELARIARREEAERASAREAQAEGYRELVRGFQEAEEYASRLEGRLNGLGDAQARVAVAMEQAFAAATAAGGGPAALALFTALVAKLEEIAALRDQAAALDRIRGPQEELARTQEALNALFVDGRITAEEYARALRDVEIESARLEQTVSGGFRAGLLEVRKAIDDVSGAAEATVVNAFRNAEDAIAQFAVTGELSVSRMVDGIIADLARLLLRQGIGLLLDAFGGGAGGIAASLFGGGRAEGGPVDRNRAYLVGEEGPELVFPRSSGTVLPADRTAAYLAGMEAASLDRPVAPSERADALIGVPPLGDDRDLAQLLERVGISLAGERALGGPIEPSSRYIGGPDAPLISTPDRAGVVYPDGAGAARFGVLASRSEAPVVHVAAPPPAQVNTYIVEDESRVVSAMTSPSGEQAIVNIVRRNRDAIRA